MFSCYDIHGNEMCCPHENDIFIYSQQVWKTTSINNILWVDKVCDYVNKIKQDHINAIYALCHLPIFIYIQNEMKVAIKTLKGYYILSCCDVFEFNSKEKNAYQEDIILSTYINKFYNNENGLNLLSIHVWLLYQNCVHIGKVPIIIRYLYEKLIKFRRLPDYISLISYQPIHTDTHIMVFNLGKILTSICKANKSHLIVYLLTRPLMIVSENEWNLMCHCRNNLRWVKKNKKQSVMIHFGKRNWESEWHITQIYYKNKKYNEKWDDRIKWIAFMFYQMYTNQLDMSLCPKDLVLVFAKLFI